jgi:alcohol dehydrogenase class IV
LGERLLFSYCMPTKIHFGVGQARDLSAHLAAEGLGPSLFLVADPGVVRAGLVDSIERALQDDGYQIERFTTIAENPRESDCQLGAEACAKFGAEAVVAIGGGSTMDTAKAIALLSRTPGSIEAFAGGHLPYEDVLPVVCVPTTAGTGSEVTRSAVITDDRSHRKYTLKDARLRPVLAVLDPLLTVTAPAGVSAATGVDALVHAIEGYTCKQASPIVRAFGAAAMRLIVPWLPRVMADPQNMEARTHMLEASLLAGLCFGSADVAAVHCLAEALGSVYDTPHGVANSIFLPHVLAFNAPAAPELHAEVSRLMGFASDSSATEEAVEAMISALPKWTAELAIPRLCDLGYVQVDDFDQLAKLAMENNSTPSNVRDIREEDYRKILDATYAY